MLFYVGLIDIFLLRVTPCSHTWCKAFFSKKDHAHVGPLPKLLSSPRCKTHFVYRS